MYFMLYSNIVMVKGKKRTLLMDLQTEQFTLIPNSMASFIKTNNKKEKEAIYQKYGIHQKPVVDEYFDWLETRGYLFWADDAKLLYQFPPLSLQWDSPFDITNIIVDIDKPQPYFNKIIDSINDCNIPFLQVRLLNDVDISGLLTSFLATTINSALKGIEVVMQYNASFDEKLIMEIIKTNIRLYQFTFYGSPEEKTITTHYYEYPVKLIYTKSLMQSHSSCGTIRPEQFRGNMQLFTESNFFNTCLNRKVGIDSEGHICNCPSMPIKYGNIADTKLTNVITKLGFKSAWYIKKEQINICKDCEFRHVCTDCRAYLTDPHDIYSKPLKCGYNPYTTEWSDWNTNPLSKKAIAYYGL